MALSDNFPQIPVFFGTPCISKLFHLNSVLHFALSLVVSSSPGRSKCRPGRGWAGRNRTRRRRQSGQQPRAWPSSCSACARRRPWQRWWPPRPWRTGCRCLDRRASRRRWRPRATGYSIIITGYSIIITGYSTWGSGSWERAWGNTTKARPGPWVTTWSREYSQGTLLQSSANDKAGIHICNKSQSKFYITSPSEFT